MSGLRQDVRYAFRRFRKDPGLTMVVVILLALGIGANTAIFSAVNAILLGKLPFKDPDQLQVVWRTLPSRDFYDGLACPPDYREWRDNNQVFEQVAGYYVFGFNLTDGQDPERVSGAPVTTNIFSLLGVNASLGRTFVPEEEEFGNHRVTVLSHGIWKRRFGADPNIIGRMVSLNGENYTVIGVMPSEFWFPPPNPQVDLWVPLSYEPNSFLNTRRNYFLSVIARLKPGVTAAQAQAGMGIIAGRLALEFKENEGSGIKLVGFREQITGDIKPTLFVLFGAVVFVLLVVCANVANLLLARAAAREKEMAIRATLGASRGRLLQQLLSESLLLALLGGIGGLLLAFGGLSLLASLIPTEIARGTNIAIEPRILVFNVGLSLLTGIIFGLVPALQTAKTDLSESLKSGGRSGSGGIRSGLRNVLVVTEIALASVLLIGAGLMIKSVLSLYKVNPGFSPENTLTMMIPLSQSKYHEPHQRSEFFQQMLQRLQALPGVQAVGATAALPLAGGSYGKLMSFEGRPAPASMSEVASIRYRQTTPDYFRAMGIRLNRGRYFTDQDGANAPGVAIINESLAQQFFPDESPIDKRIWLGPPESLSTRVFPRLTIVGVVSDVTFSSLDKPDRPTVYTPHVQGGTETLGNMYVVVRTSSEPLKLASAVQSQVWAVDKDQPVADLKTLEERLSDSLKKPNFNMLLLTTFGFIALVLAAVGIYGLLAYSVTQRTREIGIRMALGAQPRQVLRMVLKQGITLALVGVVVGLVAAFALTRVMSSLLFEVSTTDAVTFLWVPLALTIIGLVASYIPARRATKIDPMIALRQE